MRNPFVRFRSQKRVLGVTAGAFDEIAGKLAAAGINAVRNDGSIHLDGVHLSRDEEAQAVRRVVTKGKAPGAIS